MSVSLLKTHKQIVEYQFIRTNNLKMTQRGIAEMDGKPKKMPDSEFVCKLCDMFERYPDIVGWSEDGKEFLIKDVDQMQNTILPQYFRHTNFSSFVRQLNMYDFHKQYKKENKLSFKNQIFQRGNQRNFHFIQRKRKSKLSENYEQQFLEKYQGLLAKIQTNQNLNGGVKEVLENLIQAKFTMGKFIGKVREDLSDMCICLKDSRSKKVNQIVKELKGKSEKLAECMGLSKRIDAFMETTLTSDGQSNKQPQLPFKNSSFTHHPPFLQEPKSLNDISHLNMNIQIKSSFFNNPNNNSFIFMPSLMGVGGGSGFGQLEGEREQNQYSQELDEDDQGSMSFVDEPNLNKH